MIDSHCHLTDEKFRDDLDDVLGRAWDAGLNGIVAIASDVVDASAALAVAARDERIWCTAGVHPHVAADAAPDAIDRIRELLANDDMVAIGETGLDFHYDNSPRAVQLRLFEAHLQLALETDYPVVVHSRSADDDTLALIREARGVRGVLHCFAGGPALLDAALDADWYISFAGMVTFRNFNNLELLRRVPANRLLVETDSPYLAPVPHRGRRNEPAFVVDTARAVAAARGVEPGTLAASTADNARRFYNLSGASHRD